MLLMKRFHMQIFAKPLMVGWRFRFPSFLFRLCPPGHRSGIINAENIGQSTLCVVQ